MCGIVGYIGNNEASGYLTDGLSHLEYRGYDSAGIAVLNKNNINVKKSKGKLINLVKLLGDAPPKGTIGIGHTRWATHGIPSDANAHPHLSGDGKIALVHNGIIENFLELKAELCAAGYKFLSDTDTEVAVQLIHYYYRDGDMFGAVAKALRRLRGSYALGIIFADHPETLVAVRKGCPLVVGVGHGENYIASDIPAILHHTRKIYFLDEGEIALISRKGAEFFDIEKNPLQKEVYNVNWTLDAAEKGGYDHFMLKEIHEQPKILRELILSKLPPEGDKITLEGISLSKSDLDGIKRIYIVACGTAYHAGLIGKHLIEKMARIPVVAEVASEFRYKDPILDDKTLLIVVSQSGETADTLEALRIAKRSGTRVLAVVNAIGSSIAREADQVFYILAGPEIAVASTKAYSAQVTAMYLISCHIAMELGKMGGAEFREIKKELYALPEKVARVMAMEEDIKNLAKKYCRSKNVFFIGRGLDYLASMEGSLKLKEIAYLHSEAYAAGELKHGPIAMIESCSLVIAMAAQEDIFEKTLSNIKEVKARGAKVLAIATEGRNAMETETDDVLYIPRAHWMISPLLANVISQIFAYYVALCLGTDIDKPRNLAKSVTVE